MKYYTQAIVGLAALLTAGWAFAEDSAGQNQPADAVVKAIQSSLEAGKPGINVTSVEKTPVSNIYKAIIDGGPHVYTTQDGKFFFTGDIYQVSPNKIVNLTDEERNVDRARAIATIDKKDTIAFSPEGEVKKIMYVFTDVDCGYCQKLHAKMAEYNALGIEVRYLAYPRAGINSRSYRKIASAWCAKDPQAAMTKLKNRQEIEDNVCPDNPVAKQFALGQQIGLSGTPALVFESGQLIGGYVEPERLKQMLEL